MPDAEPVENMYININAEDIARARANGNDLLPRWRSKRGTSHVESLHRLTNKLLAGSCMSAELAGHKISQFDTENNIKCGIANRGDKDWGFFRHERLQYIFDLAARNGFANPLPGFKAIPSDYTSTEHFNVNYIGNLVGVSPESLAAAAAGSASAPEITPSTAHADDEAAGADLDEVAEALQLMAPPPLFSPDASGEEGPVGDVAAMTPNDSAAAPASSVLAPPVPASLPMRPLASDQPVALALTSSPVPIPAAIDATSPNDSTAAPASASLALPAPFVPAALPTPLLAPTPSRLPASLPSLLPASLQAVRSSSSQFTSSVGAAVQPYGNGSHQRPAAPSLSPQQLAALVLSGSSQKKGGRALCMADLAQPVHTTAERHYFSSNIFTYLNGNSTDFNLFCGAWNTEVDLRIAATTQVVTNLDECLYHKSPGHLKAYHDTVVQRQLLVQTETQALFAGAAAASDGRVPAGGGVRSAIGSAAAAAAAAHVSTSANDILEVAPTADVATANRAARLFKRRRRQENPSAAGAPPLFASSQPGPAHDAAAPPITHGDAGAASHPAVYQVRLTPLLSA